MKRIVCLGVAITLLFLGNKSYAQDTLSGNGAVIDGYNSGSGYTTTLGCNSPYFSHILTQAPRFYFNKPITIKDGIVAAYYVSDLQFNTGASWSTTGLTRMTIKKTNGNVGIGTTNPYAKLDVDLGSNSWTDEIAFKVGKNSRSLFMVPVATGYNYQTQSNDFGLFWNDGTGANGKNGTSGLIIAPHADSHSGIRIEYDGKVGIGANNYFSSSCTDCGDYRLFVKDGIRTEKIKVDIASGVWADYVFGTDYDLMDLEEVGEYITEEGHLPNMPSAEEVEANGVDLGEMDAKLLEKIEELTLYVIQLKAEIEKLKNDEIEE